MQIATARDLTQLKKKLKVPEIRVWCHPHYIEKAGDDYYNVFGSFKEAMDFIKKHKEAERIPLIAFKGMEINLWSLDYETRPKKT